MGADWWLGSAYNNNNAWYVNSDGSVNNNNQSNENGVRPALLYKSEVKGKYLDQYQSKGIKHPLKSNFG